MIDGEDRYARLAARLLSMQPAQVETTATEGRRDTVVAAMALAIAAKRRLRRTVIFAGVTLAAAAAVLLMVKSTIVHKTISSSVDTLLVEENIGSGNTLVRNALQKPIVDGARLVEGDAVEAQSDSSVTLGFAGGTRVTLSAAARLHVDELAATRRFSLKAGHLQAHVAKLGLGERFVVDTPDAEVEVRGTVFGISVASADGCRARTTRSTVSVSEGAVWVRSGASQVLLRPGESWTPPCGDAVPVEAAAIPRASGDPATTPRPAARMGRHATVTRPTTTPEPEPTVVQPLEPPPEVLPSGASAIPSRHESHLGEQNDLFSAAMVAEHRGDHTAAIVYLDQLIEGFPKGPLVESARAERQRILSAQPRR